MKKKEDKKKWDYANPIFEQGKLYRLRPDTEFSYANNTYSITPGTSSVKDNYKYFFLIEKIKGKDTVTMDDIDTTNMTMLSLNPTGTPGAAPGDGHDLNLGYEFLTTNHLGETRVLFLETSDLDMLEPM